MPRRPSFPKYPESPHSSGQARIKINGQHHYLGVFGSEAADREYRRLLAVWQAQQGQSGTTAPAPGQAATVASALGRYFVDATGRHEGKAELDTIWYALRPVEVLFGPMAPCQFGTAQLKVYRRVLLQGWTDPEHGPRKACCRKTVNRHVIRVRSAWRQLEMDGAVPEGSWAKLQALRPLSIGDEGAKDHPKVRPADLADVMLSLPMLAPGPHALVLLQLHTGARPSELMRLRASTIQRPKGSKVWRADLLEHKMAHKGKERSLFFGPVAQSILTPWLEIAGPEDVVISPRSSEVMRRALQRAARKTPVQPSQVNRRKAMPKRQAGTQYTRLSYGCAILRACDRVRVKLGIEVAWSAYQLRRWCATRIAGHPEGGEDLTRLVLGHAMEGVTGRYVQDSLKRVEAWMAKHG